MGTKSKIFGIIFNLTLGLSVWDYSNIPLNLFGQICAVYSVLWVALSFFAMPFVSSLNKRLKK